MIEATQTQTVAETQDGAPCNRPNCGCGPNCRCGDACVCTPAENCAA